MIDKEKIIDIVPVALQLLAALVSREGGYVEVGMEEAIESTKGKAIETFKDVKGQAIVIRVTQACVECEGKGDIQVPNAERDNMVPEACGRCGGTGRVGVSKPREIPDEVERLKALQVVSDELEAKQQGQIDDLKKLGLEVERLQVNTVGKLRKEIKELKRLLGVASDKYCHHTCPANAASWDHEALCQDMSAMIRPLPPGHPSKEGA